LIRLVASRLEPFDLFGIVEDTIYPMSTAAKLLDAMQRNPLDWRLEQLQTVARQFGLDWRQEGTSHCVFIRKDGRTLPMPSHRPIKPIYIKKFVALVQNAIP